MTQINVKFDKESLAWLRHMTGGTINKEVKGILAGILTAEGPKAVKHIRKTQLNRKNPKTVEKGAKARAKQGKFDSSGNLSRAIGYKVVTGGRAPSLSFGLFNASAGVRAYGLTQELGTKGWNASSPIKDIRPKKADFLAVPQVDNAPDSAWDFPQDLQPIIFQSAGGPDSNVMGKLVIQAEYDAARSRAIAAGLPIGQATASLPAIYLLLTRVRVRPGFFISDGASIYWPKMLPKIGDKLLAALAKRRRTAA